LHQLGTRGRIFDCRLFVAADATFLLVQRYLTQKIEDQVGKEIEIPVSRIAVHVASTNELVAEGVSISGLPGRVRRKHRR
jgi:hypothetical protein